MLTISSMAQNYNYFLSQQFFPFFEIPELVTKKNNELHTIYITLRQINEI
jgi:hypothetical protein